MPSSCELDICFNFSKAELFILSNFIKAAAYFKMKLIMVPVDQKTGKCDMRAMRRAITKNTVLVSNDRIKRIGMILYYFS